MKTFLGSFIVVLIILSGSVNIKAQTEEEQQKEKLHTFNLYIINGYALSYNFLTEKNYLLRAQLDISTNGSNSDTESKTSYMYLYSDDNKSEGNSDFKSNYFNVAFSVHFIYPVFKSKLGEAYIGAGPKFSYSNSSSRASSNYKSYYPDTTSIPEEYKYESHILNHSYNLGITAVLGIKAYLTKNIGLFAETHITGGRNWSDGENENKNFDNDGNNTSSTKSNSESNGWFYEAQFVRLGISISI